MPLCAVICCLLVKNMVVDRLPVTPINHVLGGTNTREVDSSTGVTLTRTLRRGNSRVTRGTMGFTHRTNEGAIGTRSVGLTVG